MTTTTTRRARPPATAPVGRAPEPVPPLTPVPSPTNRPAAPRAALRKPAAPEPRGSRSRHAPRVVRGTVPTGAARTAGLSLLASLALVLPAVGLLDALPSGGSTLDVAASLVVVAGLDVLAGRGLYLAAGGRARPAAYAALLSRVGHALLLAVAASLLVLRGAEGVPAFRHDWATASLVLAAHLVIAGVALWRSRVTARGPALGVAAAGAVALLVPLAPGAAGLLTVLAPVLVGEAVLAVTLLHSGMHPARWRSWATSRTAVTGVTSAGRR